MAAAASAALGVRTLARSWRGLRERALHSARENFSPLPVPQGEGLGSLAEASQPGWRQLWARWQAGSGQVASSQQAVSTAGGHLAGAGEWANGIAPAGLGLRALLGGAERAKIGRPVVATARSWSSGTAGRAGQRSGVPEAAVRLHGFHSAAPSLPFAASQLARVKQIAAKRVVGGCAQRTVQSTGRQFSSGSWSERAQQQLRQGLQWARGSLRPAPKAPKASPSGAPPAGTAVRPVSMRSAVEQLLKNPKATASRLAVQYRQAAALQVEAFWRRNYPLLLGAAALLLVLLLWRLMYGVASTFIGFSEGMAKYGFLAMASATVAFGGLYLRSRYTISPDAVYRRALRLLQVDAQVLEVLGAPLSGSEVRAYVMSGGGLRVKNWSLGLASRRCFLIFPIRGSERRGLVSAEIKKKHGKYLFKLVAVDVPTATEDQRLYVVGDEKTYVESGGVVAELRDPVVRALAKQKDFDAEDDREDAEEARLEREEYERKAREREEAAERQAAARTDKELGAVKKS